MKRGVIAMNHTRANQGGSVVSFIVIGIVLVALVAGGIYLLQHRDSNTQTGPISTKSTSPSPSTVAVKPSSSASPSASPSPSKSTAAQPPATNQKTDSGANKVPVQPLPKTGPSDLTAGGFVAAILAASAASFVQSVRARRNLFHQ